ncbi:hypothetical protein BDP81DRAFT_81204 [Colletotrichum phormii]|uniref:Uncharacterized protein n=1 Tax=Colletotrichum phormii TaxID=359342 RepID=A0AAJ0EK84_9PEZI|nr:uncharacterized protein BDP81DRAFT_81204 [Colletotrichum phormii]KAK1654317.1 hypothetical protein BDP81DRAFT_81204 [Colletotrichum phormii]
MARASVVPHRSWPAEDKQIPSATLAPHPHPHPETCFCASRMTLPAGSSSKGFLKDEGFPTDRLYITRGRSVGKK